MARPQHPRAGPDGSGARAAAAQTKVECLTPVGVARVGGGGQPVGGPLVRAVPGRGYPPASAVAAGPVVIRRAASGTAPAATAPRRVQAPTKGIRLRAKGIQAR